MKKRTKINNRYIFDVEKFVKKLGLDHDSNAFEFYDVEIRILRSTQEIALTLYHRTKEEKTDG